MGFGTYRSVLALRDVRRVLLLGLVVRIPMFAGSVILTLHVVTGLDHSYAASGLVVAVTTVAMGVSAPWRGQLLDRHGLRPTLVPSLVVLAACWSVAPFLPYWPLVALAGVAGLFVVPVFSIVRQVLLGSVPASQRTTALAVDSVVVELSFMIGPTLGVLLAISVPTSWALFVCEFASIAGGALLWLTDPRLTPASEDVPSPDDRSTARRHWLDARAVTVLAISAATTVVLTGTDVAVVAALRDMGHQSWIGWQLAEWGAGSAIGGLVYGALRSRPPAPVLLGLLAATTILPAAAREPVLLAVLLFVAGAFCAPTITASVDALSRVVPVHNRGEAMGWHGSAMTAGSAIGAPVGGVAVDTFGWQGGFVVPALLGLAVAAGAVLVLRRDVAVMAADAVPSGPIAVDGLARAVDDRVPSER